MTSPSLFMSMLHSIDKPKAKGKEQEDVSIFHLKTFQKEMLGILHWNLLQAEQNEYAPAQVQAAAFAWLLPLPRQFTSPSL